MVDDRTIARTQRDALRHEMRALGCSTDAVAREMSRRYEVRWRVAYRYAFGWSQDEVARRFSDVAAHAALSGVTSAKPTGSPARVPVMSGVRLGEYERWPHGGRRPSVYVLVVLADVFDTRVESLLDYRDHRALPAADRTVLAAIRDLGPGSLMGYVSRRHESASVGGVPWPEQR